MKNVKQYENYFSDMANYLSNIFFDKCPNFGSKQEVFSNKLYFYFEIIDTKEFEQISKCRNFLPGYDSFYLRTPDDLALCSTGIQLVIEFKNFDQIKLLYDKLELHKKTKKYNL